MPCRSDSALNLINAEPSYGASPYVLTRLCVLFSPDVPAPAKCLYSTIVAFAWNQKRTAFPSVRTLELLLGLKRTAIHNNMVILKDAGLLSWRRRGGGRTNLYRIEPIPERFNLYLDSVWPIRPEKMPSSSGTGINDLDYLDVQKCEHQKPRQKCPDVQISEHKVIKEKIREEKSPSETMSDASRRRHISDNQISPGLGLRRRPADEIDKNFGKPRSVSSASSLGDIPSALGGVMIGANPTITCTRHSGPRQGQKYSMKNPRIAAYRSYVVKRDTGKLGTLTRKELEIHYLLAWEKYRGPTGARWFPSDPVFMKLVSDQTRQVGTEAVVNYITFCFQQWDLISRSWSKAPKSPSVEVLFKLFRVFYPWFEAGEVPVDGVTERNFSSTHESEEDEINRLFAQMEGEK